MTKVGENLPSEHLRALETLIKDIKDFIFLSKGSNEPSLKLFFKYPHP